MLIDDIQRRLKKLLALSASPNKAEATLAMAKASEIMEKYNIRTMDVDVDNNTANIATYTLNGYTVEHEKWESALAASIAAPFDAKAIIHYNEKENRWCVVFVSSVSESMIIVDLYKRLRRVVSKFSKEYARGKRGAVKDSYAYGMVNTIHTRLTTLYKDTEESRALVLVKDTAIDEKIKSLFGSIKDSKAPTAENKRAYLTGEKDGYSVSLHKSIGKCTDKRSQIK